ncbi:MAG: hypothetical protein WCK90_06265 [archaeon]
MSKQDLPRFEDCFSSIVRGNSPGRYIRECIIHIPVKEKSYLVRECSDLSYREKGEFSPPAVQFHRSMDYSCEFFQENKKFSIDEFAREVVARHLFRWEPPRLEQAVKSLNGEGIDYVEFLTIRKEDVAPVILPFARRVYVAALPDGKGLCVRADLGSPVHLECTPKELGGLL